MARVAILGAGGVATAAVQKCAQLPDVFSEIYLISRTIGKCYRIAYEVLTKIGRKITCIQHDFQFGRTKELLREISPVVVINLTDPYWDLHVMDACLAAKVPCYIDTANWEPENGSSVSPETGALPRYDEQWDRHKSFEKAGLMAILGAGYDPGVTQVNVAYALKHYFETIRILHILDCNAGTHGLPFATNFNPEINIREVEAEGLYWEKGVWKRVGSIISPWGSRQEWRKEFQFIGAGGDGGSVTAELFLIYHEELQSLIRHIPGLELATFGMTFGSEYLTHLRALKNAGLTRIDPVRVYDKRRNIVEVVPIQVLKQLLPDPASLAKNYRGKTHIACYMEGEGKDGQPLRAYIYNVCDFEETYREAGVQAISYTAGVPSALAAKAFIEGKWRGDGVFNVEQLNPDPFMADLDEYGLLQKILLNNEAPHFSWTLVA